MYQTTARTRTASGCARRRGKRRGFTSSEAAIVAIVGVALLVAALSPLLRGPLPEPPSFSSVTVDPRDTLWEIASEHPVEGLTTAETVAIIRRANGLASGVIQPGQVLNVPSQTRQPILAQR
jgi:LysM repeat protein